MAEIILQRMGISVIDLKVAMDPLPLVADHFRPEFAELETCPPGLRGKMFSDFPAYVCSADDWFPTPMAMLISVLTFYLEVLNVAVQTEAVPPEQGIERIALVNKITAFVQSLYEATPEAHCKEFALTVNLWPEQLRKAF